MNFTKLAGIRQRRYGSHARDVVRECFSESTRTAFHAESADIPSLRNKYYYFFFSYQTQRHRGNAMIFKDKTHKEKVIMI